MGEDLQTNHRWKIKATALVAALTFLFATVLVKLGRDWWSDENYSHGLLVPFVIAIIIWIDWSALRRSVEKPSRWIGGGIAVFSILLLLAGTLAAELFTQRVAFATMLGGITIYFFGTKTLRMLAVPFALLLLAIPIPQIIFNRIAFPLQIWASQMAVWGIRLFDVPTLRKGNVIDILPRGATQTISLEVVEACSGIRSLMTLVTLALILAYFTRWGGRRILSGFSKADLSRTIVLMISAVPIAVLTNAARVSATGISTYYYGKQATESQVHEISGWLVYVVALVLLIAVNYALMKIFRSNAVSEEVPFEKRDAIRGFASPFLPLILAIVIGGSAVNWIVTRGEAKTECEALAALPAELGQWDQKGGEIKFGEQTESVLKTSDYTIREYTLPDGRIANVYVGYYASQRTGATYHSPQNCLPGAGWIMKDPSYVDITMPNGRTFTANRYIIINGIYKEVMIYWYQGRGRMEASEYQDKINTVIDSVTRSRSDGSIIRVMTSVGSDEPAALAAATDLSAQLAYSLSDFVPE